MKHNNYQQQGFSLVSLMVGLAISMIAILGMMSIFSSTVKSTVESTRDARLTGERATGLLVAHSRLQEAGFGIANADRAVHLLLLENTVRDADKITGDILSGAGTGNAIIWQWRDGTELYCSGLFAPNTNDEKGLYELTAKSCTSVTDAYSTDWAYRRLIHDVNDIRAPLGVSIVLAQYLTAGTGCQGFGVAGRGGVSVSLIADYMQAEAGSANPQFKSTTCLLNFAAPAAL